MQYRKEEREEISILKEEKKRLQQSIRHLTNQNQNLEANIQRVKSYPNEMLKYFKTKFQLQEEVSNQYELYRKELDARKLLINDANDLRYQQEKRTDEKEGVDDQGMKKEDPIMMKIALKFVTKNKTKSLIEILFYLDKHVKILIQHLRKSPIWKRIIMMLFLDEILLHQKLNLIHMLKKLKNYKMLMIIKVEKLNSFEHKMSKEFHIYIQFLCLID